MAEGEAVSTSAPASLPQRFDLRYIKRMSRNKWSLNLRLSDEAESPNRDKSDKDKDAGSWSAEATAALIQAFQQKRIAKVQEEGDWRIFRAEDWDAVAGFVNEECGLGGCKDGKSGKQCKYKIFNLKRRYKNEKEVLLQRGGASDWQWFMKMDILMGQPESAINGDGNGFRVRSEGEQIEGVEAAVPAMRLPMLQYRSLANSYCEPDSCSSPASKSTSTINLDEGSSEEEEEEDDDLPVESMPDSAARGFARDANERHSLKKHCGGGGPVSQFETFQANISKSMAMMARQQGEIIQLMREVVASKARQAQQELELLEDSTDVEALQLRKRIDFVELDLMSLKQICEQKKREWNEAMDMYSEKIQLRSELLTKSFEIMHKKNDKSRIRKAAS
ncbi:hypothetical protein O6H91_08G007700 [Diphasiastrum complanatum]|uniref:Uncharacterized protein n=1 Tax=Diphasiastrum complanatum TaxID=34168 RepID=A0ACC2CUV4_DIPCM|nr:hypothetical protein O6H91_08G007700 [Diphasiastrum complanatum]